MVRCGKVDDPKKWKWGSYHAYAYGIDDGITDIHPFYFDLAKNPKKRKSTYQNMIKEPIQYKTLSRSPLLSRGLIIGSLRFVKKILHKFASHPFYKQRKIFLFENVYNISRIGNLIGEG